MMQNKRMLQDTGENGRKISIRFGRRFEITDGGNSFTDRQPAGIFTPAGR